MPSIFVQIASYNDDELIKTVNSCLLKASKNNKIKIGIHECYIDKKTKINNKDVKIKYSKAPKNLGVGMGRYLSNQFYDGEDYYLQVDSHTRFIQDWDEIIINNLEQHYLVGNECILTGYPPSFSYQNDQEVMDLNSDSSLIKFKKNDQDYFNNTRIVHQESKPIDESYCSESVSGGFIFGKGLISNIVQNPAIFYYGEEILRAASFYTNGYNLMAPKKPIVFHLYGSNSNRIPCWISYAEESNKLQDLSATAIKLILSENRVGLRELGSKRTIESYGRYVGLDFKNGIYL